MNTSTILVLGENEEAIEKRVTRDKTKMTMIMKITNELNEKVTEKDIEEFYRVRKYEVGKSQPIKITFQSTAIMKEILRNVKMLKDKEDMKEV